MASAHCGASSNTTFSADVADRPNEIATTADFEFAALDRAENYRAALVAEFEPFLRGRVLEIGAGVGQLTANLLKLNSIQELVAIEPDPKFCVSFRARHPHMRLVEGTLADLHGDQNWNASVCVNVLEHIREDTAELARIRGRLAGQGGYLCLFVPARQEIYAPLDKDFGHFRRYAKPELRGKLTEAGFRIERLHYFNWVGYFAWWWSFCVLKQRGFNPGAVELFDRCIFPAMHGFEKRIARPPFGQSLLAVAQA